MDVYTLPYPPSVNTYWRHVGNRTLISRDGRAFRRKVCAMLAADGASPVDGPLDVEIELYPPDRRRRDLDNCLKSSLDALEKGGAYYDDSQIVRIVAEKRQPVDGGRMIVRVRKHNKTSEKAEQEPWRNSSRRA